MTRLSVFLAIVATFLLASAAASEVVLDVKGMTCATCPMTVRAVIKQLPGIEDVKVDGGKHTASVKFDAAKVTPDRIAKTVTEAGYPASLRK